MSLLNTSTDSTFVIEKGDRIAQLVVVAVPQVNLVVCNELTETQRGEGGFGSSGVRA
ncbi:deoxyuridine 5'-triphosphate nucleotidohydrolase [Chlamydia trachomatis]|nr:deoxyuridine 5'-triphosphate nucleotidohydrolase [Chlamydia trachomatis]